jgi:hypothetical protein
MAKNVGGVVDIDTGAGTGAGCANVEHRCFTATEKGVVEIGTRRPGAVKVRRREAERHFWARPVTEIERYRDEIGGPERIAMPGEWFVDGRRLSATTFQENYERIEAPLPGEVLNLAKALHRLMQEPQDG